MNSTSLLQHLISLNHLNAKHTQRNRSVPVQTHYVSAVPPISKNEFSNAKIVLEKERNRLSHKIFANHVHAGTCNAELPQK